jgi:hypothetical protein
MSYASLGLVLEAFRKTMTKEFDCETSAYLNSLIFSFLCWNEHHLLVYGCQIDYNHETLETTIKPLMP